MGCIGDTGEGPKAHVAASDGPFAVGLEHERADEADDGFVVEEDADDVGAALNCRHFPAMTMVIVAGLVEDEALVDIEAVAEISA